MTKSGKIKALNSTINEFDKTEINRKIYLITTECREDFTDKFCQTFKDIIHNSAKTLPKFLKRMDYFPTHP